MDINKIIAEILRIPVSDVTEYTSMESNLLWDSLSHIEIIYALEKNLGIEFNGEEIIEAVSVEKIKSIISKKQGTNLEP